MNAMFAICGLALAGWITPANPDFMEPISPTAEKSPVKPAVQQQAKPQSNGARPVRAMSDGAMRGSRMPIPPTDPRVYANNDLPLPPTINDNGMMRSAEPAGMGPRQDGADNSTRHPMGQKVFDHYRPAPATSPYMLISGSTNNGTVNPYMAYVRPAEEQQRAVQELEQAQNSDEPAPVYPRAFQNLGSYYPTYGTGR
jgi:hypothetical protein